jgi:hypothetical protein
MNEIELMKECRKIIGSMYFGGNLHADILAKLDAYIAAGGWTRVEDGLPKDETPVLIQLRGILRIGELRWERPGYEDAWCAYQYWDDPTNDGQDWDWDEVTHWRELPPLLTTKEETK